MLEQGNYRVALISPESAVTDITDAITALTFDEGDGELAQRVAISIPEPLFQLAGLSTQIQLCTRISIAFADAELFSGLIWEWNYACQPNPEINIIAYDDLIYAQLSKDVGYFIAGRTTSSIVSEICAKWGIPLQYDWRSITHAKLAFRAQTIAEQLLDVLDQAARQQGGYVASMVGRTLHIRALGTNSRAYSLTDSTITALDHALTLDKLATRVMITGKELSSGKTPVRATLDGDLTYGVIQEIVSSHSTSLAEARTEARTLLKQRGTPAESISISAPDAPWLRKGDRITISAGTLSGDYSVRAVSHDAFARTMALTLARHGADTPEAAGYPMLRYGDRGEYVSTMQRLLVSHGQPLDRFGVDGIFGAETYAAVRAFQRAASLSIDGICGPLTWGALTA